jgi:5-methylcytosine-specific restriction endonuclease McrA
LLAKDEKYLNIRTFTDSQKRAAYEKQNGICPICKEHFEINEMEGDHITPWSEGGKTQSDNLQMLCKNCNRRKGKK